MAGKQREGTDLPASRALEPRPQPLEARDPARPVTRLLALRHGYALFNGQGGAG